MNERITPQICKKTTLRIQIPFQSLSTVSGSFDDNDHESPTAPSIRKREFYDFEIIHQTTVRIERPLKNIDLVKFAYFVLVVFLFSGLCLVTEGSVPLAYILPAVSFISILS